MRGPIGALDLAGLRVTRTLGHAPPIERVVGAATHLGQHGACWLALGAAGAALDGGRRRRWQRGMRAVALAYGVNQAVKLLVRRPRPQLPDLPQQVEVPTQLSFPSAHAATSFAALRAFSGLVPAGPLAVAAGAMTYSRLYLGVHYPSDIVAGAALGLAIGTAAR